MSLFVRGRTRDLLVVGGVGALMSARPLSSLPGFEMEDSGWTPESLPLEISPVPAYAGEDRTPGLEIIAAHLRLKQRPHCRPWKPIDRLP